MEATKKREKPNTCIWIDKWPRPIELRSWKVSFKSEVSHASHVPEPLCYGWVKLRMPKVSTVSLLMHLQQEKPILDFKKTKISDQDYKRTQENPDGELQKRQGTTAEGHCRD